MDHYSKENITTLIAKALVKASQTLEEPLVERIEWMRKETENSLKTLSAQDSRIPKYEASIEVLSRIQENLKLSKERGLPMCQDTGMVVAWIEIGVDVPLTMLEIKEVLKEGITIAEKEGYFRNSVVEEPLFERKNRGTNNPPIIYWFPKEERGLTIRLMLKGFGSENNSALAMLNPTSTVDQLIATVTQMVKNAGGKPCPPVVVGVGIGGTADQALLLSKRALFRKVGEPHFDQAYAQLERDLEEAIQNSGVGPGGFGGPLTTLGVSVEHAPTHIAGLPVGVSISCWTDRKATIEIGGSDA